MSQIQLAKLIGAGVRSVGRWERGKAVPRSHIGALEDVLGIDLSQDAPGTVPWYDEDDPVERGIAEDPRLPEPGKRDLIAQLRAGRMKHNPQQQKPPA